jgi:hypothetical protein
LERRRPRLCCGAPGLLTDLPSVLSCGSGSTTEGSQRMVDGLGRFALTGRNPDGRFTSGQHGPGRPKGSRNRFAEASICDVFEAWTAHAKDVLERVAKEDPVAFLRLAGAVAMHAKPRARPVCIDADEDGGSDEGLFRSI